MTSLILITGMPGVGKTTLVKKLSAELKLKGIHFQGFYTEEVRNSGHERIGFDVISFEGHRGILARDSSMAKPTPAKNKVGKYSVCVEDFEAIANPILCHKTELLVIDEIGKMEMKSNKFENSIKSILESVKAGKMKLIATIPQKATIQVVENMKIVQNSKLFNVTKSNRDQIYDEILSNVVKMLK